MEKEIRDIRVVFFIFCCFFALLAWKIFPSALSVVCMVLIVGTLGLLGFSPGTLRPLYKRWLKLAHVLGKINTQIILFIVFALVAIPAGLILRLVAKDPMKRRMETDKSYWEPIEFEGIKEKNRYEKQF